ncbi:MAG: hypothetical protein HYR80_10055 [Nitrospirae bacterium]|nr:hypothetical protein [Nitrospirota bacterium]MBI3805335.1 hypothetical protein [Candidatus Manganitrophaceae bacterium]
MAHLRNYYRTALLSLFLMIPYLLIDSSFVFATDSLPVQVEFAGGSLQVSWGGVPQTRDGKEFQFWTVEINADGLGRFVCGLAIAGAGPCPFGVGTTSKNMDVTAPLLQGAAPVGTRVTVNIGAYYDGSPGASWIEQYHGSFSENRTTPPIGLQEVAGTKSGRINTLLKIPYLIRVRFTRLGQELEGGNLDLGTFGLVSAFPAGATGQRVGSAAALVGGSPSEVNLPFTVGNKDGNYNVLIICSLCNNQQSANLTYTINVPKASLTLTANPKDVWPAGYPESISSISLEAIDGLEGTYGPLAGYDANLNIQPIAFSGGHDHSDLSRPPGTLKVGCKPPKSNCWTYTGSILAGEELIIATALSDPLVTGQTLVNIAIPDLGELTDSVAPPIWRLTGKTGSHSSNHFGTAGTNAMIRAMAKDYYNINHESIGINDMSLPKGGLFDVNANWSPDPGHVLHREGKSVDIDRCAQTKVKQDLLDRGASDFGGSRTVEKPKGPLACDGPPDTARIHYDFP